MERKEQTGHICRWMALGIITAIVIVGCTIGIGLFEWRDRSSMSPNWPCSVKRLPTGIQQM